ncbi:3-phosphoserine/phosphohydroxythreonine transaminase [Salinisphaera sp.]|uniref:3-phosphoserine/phosphohydroxythreonine transaminase n=1 Tax=Salinisphaera sp. TaxID=1914330 RepID=UPI000C39D074|nr:3-phosphoserine/phosphohydroxythreonine transaminase [Salinisphaera sp.]MAS10679.1 3-phosphoserine/phosphohydroxythreonine aminotransferase [Salinisphaera sp.]|tara:strand:+ start:1156 stop:2238 length:1083 start_codon:yes stop_codon:yes gene_type:complete
MARVYNFSAGPATLPVEVLEKAQADLLDWQGSGMSVMEMSHRGDAFVSIAEKATQDLRKLLNVPDNYSVLFLQGGAAGQFAGVPMNLFGDSDKADYVVTGNWGKKAVKEAKKYGDIAVAASSEEGGFTEIPDRGGWQLRDDAAYVHYTPNETIQGVEFPDVPEVGDVPLVADWSSAFLSKPIDVSKYGVIYAGAQKNAGPAGVTMVIVRNDLMGSAIKSTPMVLDYQQQADADSMLNTPPCFAWYMAGLTFEWILANGGLEGMAERNKRKADKLYGFIDSSDFYRNPVAPEARSRMNVPFLLADDDLNKAFLAQAEEAGLSTLKGHRSVGGMRASIYNAMPEAGVDALIDFMRGFEKDNG